MENNACYHVLEESWKDSLENELRVLAVICESKSMSPKSKKVMTQICKNKIKRCRWNITRAINLRKRKQAARKIDLHATVDRVAKLAGKEEIVGLLEQFESIIEGYTTKQRKKVMRTLTICDERDIDGG